MTRTNCVLDCSDKNCPVLTKIDVVVIRCRICDSVMHFQRYCLHSYENQSKQVFESIEESADEVRNLSLKDEHVLMVEAVNAAVLDCTCSRNVIGKVWKDTFIACLGPD